MANASKITTLLLKQHPDPKLALNYKSPLELLIAVILSAQCTDARVNEVTKTLFKKYKSAKQYANADIRKFEQEIRSTGFYKNKAKTVIRCCADIRKFEQEIRSTGFYKNKAKTVIRCCQKLVKDFAGRVPANIEDMVALPGVGRKTANMVIGNAFGKQGIAVDTHVLRVGNRLGLVQSKDAVEVERELMKQVSKNKWTAFSNAVILHGREICTARKPHCGECILYKECEWADKL
jgi:endonuclease-3